MGQRVHQGLPSLSLSPGPPQRSVPAEEAHFINTKQLKFLLARSRWQVSLQRLGVVGRVGVGAEGGEGRRAVARGMGEGTERRG